MEREHARRATQKTPQGGVIEGQLDQGVNSAGPEEKVDLREAVSGDYRFQGTLVRAFYISGRTWFVASEVCAALEIANPRDAIKLIDPEDRGVGIVYTPRGEQSVNLVNESALYFLIFKSRKPQARAFRRWVTGEVLPQIRQTGALAANGQVGRDDSIVLPFPDALTRYVIVTAPGRPPHIRRTGISEIVTEFTALDRQAMCYTLKQIEVWWNKVQIKESPSFSQDEGFAIHKLDAAIREGSEMADHFLHVPVRDGLTSHARDS
jgi:hypothetical protein